MREDTAVVKGNALKTRGHSRMELGYILQHSMQERNVGIISLTSLVYETVLGCQKKGINTHLQSKIKVFEIIICDMEER